MKKLLIAFAGLAGLTAPSVASAQTATVTYSSTTAIPSNNDFQSSLAGLGLTQYASTGSTITLSGPAVITFYFLGSESGYSDTFSTNNGAPNLSYTETSQIEDHFGAPILIGSDVFAAGSLTGLLNFTTSGLGIGGGNATVGDAGFGIFLGPNATSPVTGLTTFYFGYDDQVTNKDDNHDDFIVKAVITPLPEPATWAMMLLGFAGIGMAVRRKRQPIAQIA